MFDLRKFWLGAAVYGLIVGGVIVAAGAAFNTFIGMPTKVGEQVVAPTAPIQVGGGNAVPVETAQEVATPEALAQAPTVRRPPVTSIAATPSPPKMIMPPVPQIIVPEPRSTRRDGSSR
jgi:hypothetical protein